MVLKGPVRNIADFRTFVDIGVYQDDLVHISHMLFAQLLACVFEATGRVMKKTMNGGQEAFGFPAFFMRRGAPGRAGRTPRGE